VAHTVSSITVTPTAADAGAAITVNEAAVISGQASSPIALSEGDNTITVEVTAADGETKVTYTIVVTRAAPPSTNANLSGLVLPGVTLNPSFDTDTTSYTANVAHTVNSITVTPTAADAGATITVNEAAVTSGQASSPIALSEGNNTITVEVTAADGETKVTYTITVTRAAPPSTNANLSGLVLPGVTLSPSFAGGTTGYTANVVHTVNSITVTPTAADAGATITVNEVAVTSGQASDPIALSEGDNTITVEVTAADGETKVTYTITVTKAAPPSTNANLSGLTLPGVTLSPSFASGTTGYTANVAHTVSSITVTPTAADAGASVIVNEAAVTSGQASNPIALSEGNNTITVEVTAADGETKVTYTITVTRATPTWSGPSDQGSSYGTVPGSPDVVVSRDGHLLLSTVQSGEVSLEDAVKLVIPQAAFGQELLIKIEEVLDTSGLLTNQQQLASEIYEITKNFEGKFNSPVTLTFAFDASRLQDTQRPVIYYFDETTRRWIDIGGTVVGNEISVQVDHFTKFAVFIMDEKQDSPKQDIDFKDIAGTWAESNIKLAAGLGWVSGYGDGTFRPDRAVTRAEFTVMLMNALNLPKTNVPLTFSDSEKIGEWARQAIAQAIEAGIVSGYTDGSFRPNAHITRAEMAVMTAAALESQRSLHLIETQTAFADDEAIPSWAKSRVAALKELGLIAGKTANRFSPLDQTTRAEAVTVLIRLLEVLKQ